MKFEHRDEVEGLWVVRPERRSDERGHFARLFCDQEFATFGLATTLRQINAGFSPRRGTLRGLHFQQSPHAEVKIVRCTRGAVFDVAVDLRPQSPTYRRWYGIELRADEGTMLYAPAGTAHGYLTLEPDTELVYATSEPYAPTAARGIRYDDPAIGIVWPTAPSVISEADRHWPFLSEGASS